MKLRKELFGFVSVVALSTLVAAPAQAQAAEAEGGEVSETREDTDARLGKVVVTATRTGSPEGVPTPLAIVSADQLQEAARPNLVAALNDLPQFKASWTASNSGTGFNAGAYSVDLRGLGANRTLVLVDGRRFLSSSVRPDLSVIPGGLVERAEVVTGSASAAWGSGAVAGVVNLIMDSDFDGVRANAQYGISDRDDVEERRIDFAIGRPLFSDRGHLVFAAEFVDNEGAQPRASRSNVGRWGVVSNPDFAPSNGQLPLILAPNVGFAIGSSGGLILSGVNAGQTFNPDGTLRAFNFGRVSGANTVGGEGPSFDDLNALVAPSQRLSAYSKFSYDLAPDLQFSADLIAAEVSGSYPWLADFNFGNIIISAENAFLPASISNQMIAAGQSSFVFGRFHDDFATINLDYKRRNVQASVQLDGPLVENWRWTAYATHGVYNDDFDLENQIIRANLVAAVDAVRDPNGQIVCRVALTNPNSGCSPINLFGEGVSSAAAREYVLGTASQRREQTLDAAAFTIRGDAFDVGAGPFSFALGLEAREESVEQISGALDQANAFQFINIGVLPSASNTTKEGFAEVLAPLLADLPGIKKLHVNAAARFTDDATGSNWSWKLGATNEVIDGLTVRGAVSRDIRAPTLDELFAPRLINNVSISDPIAGGATYTVRTFAGGNPDLVAETSETWTAGFTFQPRFLPGLNVSADYFDINIDNAISVAPAQSILDACSRGNAGACGSITRGVDGLITEISSSQLNFTEFKTSGVDAAIDYRVPVDLPGALKLRLSGTWADEFVTNTGLERVDFLRSQGTIQALGVARLQANGAVIYDGDTFGASLRARYISDGVNNITRPIQNNDIPAFTYVDLGVRWSLEPVPGRRIRVQGNVNNLFDKDPPPGTAFTPYYDVIGRYYSLGVRVEL